MSRSGRATVGSFEYTGTTSYHTEAWPSRGWWLWCNLERKCLEATVNADCAVSCLLVLLHDLDGFGSRLGCRFPVDKSRWLAVLIGTAGSWGCVGMRRGFSCGQHGAPSAQVAALHSYAVEGR